MNLIKKYQLFIIFTILISISFFAFLYFYSFDGHLVNGDALSRLNISRKITDNLTPGFAQVGNVWLPLPQLFMSIFSMNSFLWHSGISGAIVSMSSFVIGGLFLYKTIKEICGSVLSSLFGLLIYALNINILYFQTTAMSESIFITSIIISIYFFTKWINNEKKLSYLILAGISVSASTLIRYEGLAILAFSVPMVIFYSWIKNKNYSVTEGKTLIYLTIAAFGFFLWTMFLTFIFKDPFYWKNYYTSDAARETATGIIEGYVFNLSIWGALFKYITAVIWMNGIIPVLMSIMGLVYLIYRSYKEKTYFFLPLLLISTIVLFMVYTLQRNTPINQPEITIANILSGSTQSYLEFNIRYGLLMIPLVSILSAYLFNVKYKIIKIFLILILLIQYYSYFKPAYSVIYQIPQNLSKNITQGSVKEKDMVKWLNANYDGGLIMISALKHDPQMFQLGYDYKTYIHEGAGAYWKESTKNPQLYATWIIFDSWNRDDQVTKYLNNSKKLNLYFNRVYENNGLYVYKIKAKPSKSL